MRPLSTLMVAEEVPADSTLVQCSHPNQSLHVLLLLSGTLLVVLTSTPALPLLSNASVLLSLLLPGTTILPLPLLRLLLPGTTILPLLLLRLLLVGTTKLPLLLLRLLLSGPAKSLPPPAVALKPTASGESVRIHRWCCCCCCRHNRLALAVSVGGTEDFLSLSV